VCGKSTAGDSPYGLCDMAGNVYEWLSDRYASDYYGNSPSTNPAGPDIGMLRVFHGGSFYCNYDGLRVSFRYGEEPTKEFDWLGFRCALTQVH